MNEKKLRIVHKNENLPDKQKEKLRNFDTITAEIEALGAEMLKEGTTNERIFEIHKKIKELMEERKNLE